MRIIFVRHGHPNYEKDCLTPLGHQHAKAAAERLKDEGIRRIFSSTHGRALETAAPLAALLGLPVEGCEFMREIRWGAKDGTPLPDDGHPWTLADRMVADGTPLLADGWENRPGFSGSRLVPCVQEKAAALDGWLASLGYIREGAYYRVSPALQPGLTVAAFGHGGESAALLSHLFNLPFPFVCAAMGPDYTGVTIVQLPERVGELVAPRFELMNDARHIRGLETTNIYGL